MPYALYKANRRPVLCTACCCTPISRILFYTMHEGPPCLRMLQYLASRLGHDTVCTNSHYVQIIDLPPVTEDHTMLLPSTTRKILPADSPNVQ